MIFNGLFTDDSICVKHKLGAINYKHRLNLCDQLCELAGVLYYGYWGNNIGSNHLHFDGWYEFDILIMIHHGITIYPHVIHIGGTKETPYLTLENTAHNIGLLRSYAVT